MASKLLLFLSAFLAVQAFAWGETVPSASLEWVAPADGGSNELEGTDDPPPALSCVCIFKDIFEVLPGLASLIADLNEFLVALYNYFRTCILKPTTGESLGCVCDLWSPAFTKIFGFFDRYSEIGPKLADLIKNAQNCMSFEN